MLFILMIYNVKRCMADEIRMGFMGYSGGHSPVAYMVRLSSALPVAIDKISENSSILTNYNIIHNIIVMI